MFLDLGRPVVVCRCWLGPCHKDSGGWGEMRARSSSSMLPAARARVRTAAALASGAAGFRFLRPARAEHDAELSASPTQPRVEPDQRQHEDDSRYDRMRGEQFHASAPQVQPNGHRDQHSDDRHGSSGIVRCYLSHASAPAGPPHQRDAQHEQRCGEQPHAFRLNTRPVRGVEGPKAVRALRPGLLFRFAGSQCPRVIAG